MKILHSASNAYHPILSQVHLEFGGLPQVRIWYKEGNEPLVEVMKFFTRQIMSGSSKTEHHIKELDTFTETSLHFGSTDSQNLFHCTA